jgi:hypothetical protein
LQLVGGDLTLSLSLSLSFSLSLCVCVKAIPHMLQHLVNYLIQTRNTKPKLCPRAKLVTAKRAPLHVTQYINIQRKNCEWNILKTSLKFSPHTLNMWRKIVAIKKFNGRFVKCKQTRHFIVMLKLMYQRSFSICIPCGKFKLVP